MPVLLLLAAALGTASAPPAAQPPSPTFAVVPHCQGVDRCIAGAHSAGLDVVLVSADATCALKTGNPAAWRRDAMSGSDPALPATALVGTCPGDFVLAAIGAPGSSFSRVKRQPVTSPTHMEALLLRIANAEALDRVFADAQAQGEHTTRDALASESPSEAFTLEGVAESPAFVRFPLRTENGPVVVVEKGRVSTPLGVCSGPLVPFRLGGRVFAHAWSGLCASGAVGQLVFEIVDGRLTRVFAGYELAD